MKYCSKITGNGPDAFAFLGDPDTNFIIIFNNDAPPALAELCVLHEPAELMDDVQVGDTMVIADMPFTVSAVGSEANATLRGLGHCTLDFKGGSEAERPGCIMLEGDEVVTANDIVAGATIEIY